MLFLKLLAGFIILTIMGLWLASVFISQGIKKEFPPVGEFRTINGAMMHFVDTGEVEDAEAPAIIFIHGAGGNLNDPMPIYRKLLEDKFRVVFLDRPGQGYSESLAGSNDIISQTDSIIRLMDELRIEKAIIVGHSFGGALTGVFGVLYPQQTAGLVFLAPVSHPWDTGIDWHYHVGDTPGIGWLFSNTIAPVAGDYIYPGAIKRLFLPNSLPSDYRETSMTRLALLPRNFQSNARDIAGLHAHVSGFHPRYKEITAPTHIFHGDEDDIVNVGIHSINGLSKDIKNSKLFVLSGVGHKPDYVASEQVIKSILEIAGSD